METAGAKQNAIQKFSGDITMPTVNDNAALYQTGGPGGAGQLTDDGLHQAGLLNGVANAFAWNPYTAAANDGNKGKVVTANNTDVPTPALTGSPTLQEATDLAAAQGAEPDDLFRYSTGDGADIEWDVYDDDAGGITLVRKDDIQQNEYEDVLLSAIDPDTYAPRSVITIKDSASGARTAYWIDPADPPPQSWTELGTDYSQDQGVASSDILESGTDPTGVAAGAYKATLFNGVLYPKQNDGNFGPMPAGAGATTLLLINEVISADTTFTSAQVPSDRFGFAVDISAGNVLVEIPNDKPLNHEITAAVNHDSRTLEADPTTTTLTIRIGDGTGIQFVNHKGEVAGVQSTANMLIQGETVYKRVDIGGTEYYQHLVTRPSAIPFPIPIVPVGTVNGTDLNNFVLAHTSVSGGSGAYTDYAFLMTFLDVGQGGRTITINGAVLGNAIGAGDIADSAGILTPAMITGTLGSFSIDSALADIYGSIDVDHTITDDAALSGTTRL